MIYDQLDKLEQYESLNPLFRKAFEFLLRDDIAKLGPGRQEIDGSRIYASVTWANGKRPEDAPLEIHRKYIDIQAVLDGTDAMGWKSASACVKPMGEYDESKDIQFFSDKPDTWVKVGSGQFVVFFPNDAHAPMVSSSVIHKIVIKVAVSR